MNGFELQASSAGSTKGALAALAAVIVLAVAGCAGIDGPAGLDLGGSVTTGSIDKPAAADAAQDAAGKGTAGKDKASLVALARAHAEKPDDRPAALAYAASLKSAGKLREASAVLDRLSDAGKGSLLVERALLALEAGDAAKARRLLEPAKPETSKDWRVLSAMGVAEATDGRHAKAQDYFKKALALSPGNPVVLNNMGLSLILDGKVADGQALLRDASKGTASQPRIGQNLALATALPTSGADGSKVGLGGPVR